MKGVKMNCIFCQREINNKGSLTAHQRTCKLNPERTPYIRSPNAGRKAGKDYVVWNRGLTKETDSRLAEQSKNLSAMFKGKPGTPHTEDTKRRMSESRKKLYESGWEPTCGRCKNTIMILRLPEK